MHSFSLALYFNLTTYPHHCFNSQPVEVVTMSRKHQSNKGHRRAASIGTTLDKMLRPQLPLEKSSSANSSFEKGFDRERGERTLSERSLKGGEVVTALALEHSRREPSPLILPPRPASLSPTLGLVHGSDNSQVSQMVLFVVVTR